MGHITKPHESEEGTGNSGVVATGHKIRKRRGEDNWNTLHECLHKIRQKATEGDNRHGPLAYTHTHVQHTNMHTHIHSHFFLYSSLVPS